VTQPEAQALVAKWMTNFHPWESLVEGVARQLCDHVGELETRLTTAQELARLGGWRE